MKDLTKEVEKRIDNVQEQLDALKVYLEELKGSNKIPKRLFVGDLDNEPDLIPIGTKLKIISDEISQLQGIEVIYDGKSNIFTTFYIGKKLMKKLGITSNSKGDGHTCLPDDMELEVIS
jgi:hypothetical protein